MLQSDYSSLAIPHPTSRSSTPTIPYIKVIRSISFPIFVRFTALVDLANAIQNCCQLTEESFDDDEDESSRKKSKRSGGKLREKTYLVVSYNTIAGSTTTLVHILENVLFHYFLKLTKNSQVCSLMATLMKLDCKSRGPIQLNDESSLDEPSEYQQRDYLIMNLCPALKECMTAAVAVRLIFVFVENFCSFRNSMSPFHVQLPSSHC